VGSVTKGYKKNDSSSSSSHHNVDENESLKNNEIEAHHPSKKAKLSANDTSSKVTTNKNSMNTDTNSKAAMSLIDSNQNVPINRIMRNTSLNLTNSSSSGQTSKRLVIKNLKGNLSFFSSKNWIKLVLIKLLFKETPKTNEDFFTKLWQSLEAAVTAIHKSNPVSMSLEILYQYVENLCSEKKSNLLYASLKQLCEVHIKSEVSKLIIYPFIFLLN
jgi:translation initiation factor 2B subunit (eIF-2B alpha/beta/delta family)